MTQLLPPGRASACQRNPLPRRFVAAMTPAPKAQRCPWQMAAASASAASSSGSSARPRMAVTICCIWPLPACPYPVNAFFTCTALYSDTAMSRSAAARSATPAHLAELERALDVARQKDLLQADVGGLVFPDDLGQPREDPVEAPVLGLPGRTSDRAVGDVPQAGSIRADHTPAGLEGSGVYAQDRFDVSVSDDVSRPAPGSRRGCRSWPRRFECRRGLRVPR